MKLRKDVKLLVEKAGDGKVIEQDECYLEISTTLNKGEIVR
jgi:hypothetical protein